MEQNFFVDQFFKGGPMMWPMLLCSLIALGVIIDRLWNLMKVPGEEEAEQQLNAAEDVLKSQGEGGAVDQFRQGSGVLNFIFAALVKRYDSLVLENRTDLEESGSGRRLSPQRIRAQGAVHHRGLLLQYPVLR